MEFRNDAFERLLDRGFVYQMTHEKEIKERLQKGPVTFYLGIDPTADNLHIGHFFSLQMFRILQECGHRGVLLIGGATAMIGDPTGKKDMRRLMPKEEVEHNASELMELVKRFIITDGDNPAIIVNNADWFKDETYVGFMRKVGVHFNVNTMLASEAYKKRLEEGGLTFFEMGYMLMQAFDFVHLNDAFGCELEIGGSDQWANVLAGSELSRKMKNQVNEERPLMMGFTCPLLTNANGVKMGKTEKGTLWVNRDKTSVYDFYQHFLNCLDADVERLLRFFTNIPVSEIKEMCEKDIVSAKKRMAFEVSKLVHGEEEANNAKIASEKLFGSKDVNDENIPSHELKLTGEINVVDFLSFLPIISSKSEARRLIEQGGITIDDKKILSIDETVNCEKENKMMLVKKGKKTFLRVDIL